MAAIVPKIVATLALRSQTGNSGGTLYTPTDDGNILVIISTTITSGSGEALASVSSPVSDVTGLSKSVDGGTNGTAPASSAITNPLRVKGGQDVTYTINKDSGSPTFNVDISIIEM